MTGGQNKEKALGEKGFEEQRGEREHLQYQDRMLIHLPVQCEHNDCSFPCVSVLVSVCVYLGLLYYMLAHIV